MRRRSISSSISIDGRVAAAVRASSVLAAVLYTWGLTHCDDWGRMSGELQEIRLTVTPGIESDPQEFAAAVDAITAQNLWQRYEVDGRWYIAYPPRRWFVYQSYIATIKRTIDKSKFPAPPAKATASALPANIPNSPANIPNQAENIPENAQNGHFIQKMEAFMQHQPSDIPAVAPVPDDYIRSGEQTLEKPAIFAPQIAASPSLSLSPTPKITTTIHPSETVFKTHAAVNYQTADEHGGLASEALRRLYDVGVNPKTLDTLTDTDPSVILRQLEWWQDRITPKVRDEIGLLVTTIRENWPAPAAWIARQAAEEEKAARDATAALQRSLKQQEADLQERRCRDLDAIWECLSPDEKAELQDATLTRLKKKKFYLDMRERRPKDDKTVLRMEKDELKAVLAERYAFALEGATPAASA